MKLTRWYSFFKSPLQGLDQSEFHNHGYNPHVVPEGLHMNPEIYTILGWS